MFKKALITLVLVASVLSFAPNQVKAADENTSQVNAYLFYGEGCPHCVKEQKFLASLDSQTQNQLNLQQFEVYYSSENGQLFNKVADYFGITQRGVPLLIIGDQYVIGYGSDDTTGEEIKDMISYCSENVCDDPMQQILAGEDPQVLGQSIDTNDNSGEDDKAVNVNLPLIGKVDLKSMSLPVATILIGFVDGFNPCAMWILIFLITMLINMKDKKKLYILGSTFIIVSALVYFVFLAAWFNFFKFIGYVKIIKVIIGMVAIFSGISHIKHFFASEIACNVTNQKQKLTIMQRTKQVLNEKRFIVALAGIAILAVAVNLVELVCSAGLPAIYTNLLSTIDLTTTEYYSYLALYILVFMLDDLIVFFVAIKTFEIAGVTHKYTRWSNLIGGIIIFILGIILLLKPELLMFG